MVLAVIIGIGTNLFGELTALVGGEPEIAEALSLLMGALTLFGLGIFGPAIASGLVSGAPQLGAGAAVGTAAGAARSEEHTSELQSLMRISYAVVCWKKKKKHR